MFDFKICSHPLCNEYICAQGPYCYRHSPEQKTIHKSFIALLEGKEAIRDYSLTNGEFEGVQVLKKEFISSNLAWCTFRDMDFSKSIFITCFFDFCLFERCSFHGITSRYSIFSGSKMIDCDFSDSTITHTNFLGIDSMRCNFSQSDLYYSNFGTSLLRDTDFSDCNLTRTGFTYTDKRRVSFRYSNYEEAHQ